MEEKEESKIPGSHARAIVLISLSIVFLVLSSSQSSSMWVKVYESTKDYYTSEPGPEVARESRVLTTGAKPTASELYYQPDVGLVGIACQKLNCVSSEKDTTITLSRAKFPCGKESSYLGAMVVKDATAAQKFNAQGQPCDDILRNNDFHIYNCSMYSVDYDNNESFCKQMHPGCFSDDGGTWEPTADNGRGECCGDDLQGDNYSGSDHSIDDPDMGPESCQKCQLGLNVGKRYWSRNMLTIAPEDACCGDDEQDCLNLRDNNRYICWDFGGQYSSTSQDCPNPLDPECQSGENKSYSSGSWMWSPAGFTPGAIFNISCSQMPVVSDGYEWLGCTNKSFEMQSSCLFSVTPIQGFAEVSPE